MTPAASDIVTVSDLKQFAFCPRIPYFSRVMPIRPPATELMERGQRLEEEFRRLEVRRSLGRYGWDRATRHFSVYAMSESCGIAGRIDLALERDDAVAIVDVKASGGFVGDNHRMQAAAYQVLAGEHFGKPCIGAFMYFLDRRCVERLEPDAAWNERLRRAIDTIRAMSTTHDFPPATAHRKACEQCEYRNFCGDVF
ncbi:MAG: CRISPR-associated protein Cas4 [Candidatus Lindowbacteria bacterium RIFCSPLOWO2_12_FULL_62_27]|nr:MAG: CRISPR-associated protein Cas4 [Candidatus Lindowbacteria bacterium RIFCSPLOWO2_02_FULL_62_12]OGH62662.1 MAG: CRISPR-associated protein Cas4 [Candidatus Lindowbacteria bacterium RIFCSPLOWO2_12_FULL_62_27]